MPAHNPTESIKYDPNLETIPEVPSEEAAIETTNRLAFFSPTNIAIAFVGVGLAVTAYFSAPLAIAAICTLGLTGLAYGAAQYFGFFEESTGTSANTETLPASPPLSSPKNEFSAQNKPTNSFTTIAAKLPPETQIESRKIPSPIQKHNQDAPDKDDEQDETVLKNSSGSHDSDDSIMSNNM